jgi:hypothetical protein
LRPTPPQGVGEPKPGLGIIRLELNGLVEDLEGFLEPPTLLEGDSEICEIIRFGILPEGASDPFNCTIVLPGANTEQAHQMERVCISGICRQRLLGTELRVEISAGQHMADTSFTERSGRDSRASRDFSSELYRGPTFASVHVRTYGLFL